MAVISTAIVWKGSSILESTAERLAVRYRLPGVVQGSLLTAVGSSMPELASMVVATLAHGEFDLGVSVVIGSAIFNVLVIPAASGLGVKKLSVDRNVLYKDAQFYMTSVAVLLSVFSLAVIYMPVAGERLLGTLPRSLSLVPLAFYALYVFLQRQDTVEGKGRDGTARSSPSHAVGLWLRLGLGLALILVSVEGLVRSAIGLGEYFQTPSFLWGVTVIAAATSLPDLFVSVKAGREGKGVVSMANMIGSNVFDLLVAIPVGVLLAGSVVVDYAVAAPLMGALVFATVLLFALLRKGMGLDRKDCWILLAVYAAFVAWILLETFGITTLLRHDPSVGV